MNDKEKIEEDDSLILAWDQYIQGQAELIENIRPEFQKVIQTYFCLLYTSPSPRDATLSRMPSSA